MADADLDSAVPAIRIRGGNTLQVNTDGAYVLYWMTANRRVHWNYSMERAVDWARQLRKPLLVLEALRCDYPWASDRFHAFVMQGMADNARQLQGRAVTYYPYVEPALGRGKGLLAALATQAVTPGNSICVGGHASRFPQQEELGRVCTPSPSLSHAIY